MSEVPREKPLAGSFFSRPAAEVARDLLGAVLVSVIDGERTAGRIVEAEAYVGPHDPASHAAERIGRTARNESMFGPPGTAYVYRIYGIHWCLNAVTDAAGYPAAVLIRALEPTAGPDIMARRRGLEPTAAPGSAPPDSAGPGPAPRLNGATARRAPRRGSTRATHRLLAGGPGRLAQALGITGELDGSPLQEPPLYVLPGDPVPDRDVVRGPRIGVTRAGDWPLRFCVRGSPYVSR